MLTETSRLHWPRCNDVFNDCYQGKGAGHWPSGQRNVQFNLHSKHYPRFTSHLCALHLVEIAESHISELPFTKSFGNLFLFLAAELSALKKRKSLLVEYSDFLSSAFAFVLAFLLCILTNFLWMPFRGWVFLIGDIQLANFIGKFLKVQPVFCSQKKSSRFLEQRSFPL